MNGIVCSLKKRRKEKFWLYSILRLHEDACWVCWSKVSNGFGNVKAAWNADERLSDGQETTQGQFDMVGVLNWSFIVIFSFLTKLAIKFHKNPYIVPLKWSAREPGLPVQHPRDLVPWDGYSVRVRCDKILICLYSFVKLSKVYKPSVYFFKYSLLERYEWDERKAVVYDQRSDSNFSWSTCYSWSNNMADNYSEQRDWIIPLVIEGSTNLTQFQAPDILHIPITENIFRKNTSFS